MSLLRIKAVSQNQLALVGEAVFDTVPHFQNNLPSEINNSNSSISLSQVTKVDSAGLAMLLEWLVMAEQVEIHLRYIDIPDQLKAMSQLSNLDHLLWKG